MARMIQVSGAASSYQDILDILLTEGTKQESRNGTTLEIEDMIIELINPAQAVIGSARPGYNEAIGAVEGLQLLAGISDSSLTSEIQPNFRAFMDDGELWGAYGPRTVDQLPVIAERLRADHDTRQAIVTLWDPKFDAAGGKKDHPCTTAFNFRIRRNDFGEEHLNMTTFMRSNDAYWGWPYDIYQFVMLQVNMATILGMQVGTYTHHAASFHLYEPHWGVAKDIVNGDAYTGTAKSIRPIVYNGKDVTWDNVRNAALDVWHVVRGVKSANDVLLTSEQAALARLLLERKLRTGQKNLAKLPVGLR